MSDRNSAEVFSKFFDKLATDPTKQHKKWAKEIFADTRHYDFSTEQMECDKALIALGLAERKPDPSEPGEQMIVYHEPWLDEEK